MRVATISPVCAGRFFRALMESRVVSLTDKCYRPAEPRGSANFLPAVHCASGVTMAKPGTTRRSVLHAVAALPALAMPTGVRAEPFEAPPPPADRAVWNARLARYRHLAARAKAAAETGWFRAANDRFYRESADPAADRKAAFARMTRAENLYWHRCTAPLHEAAVALVLTVPPNIEALRDKLGAIRAHQLHEEGSMKRDCIEVLEGDLGILL